MAASPVVTVQARRPSADFWMVWVGTRLAGSIHSYGELGALLERLGVPLDHVGWEPGAEADLRASGPLPPGTRGV
jgi:hypothetical protein